MENTFSISKDGKTAVIDIIGHIGFDWFEESGNDKKTINKQLKDIANISDVDTIQVNIDSPGGSLDHALSIHDLLVEHPARIETYIHGMTASAATVIAMAGDEINISDNALLLVHNSSAMAIGNKNDIKGAADLLDVADKRIANIYAKRSGKDQAFHLEQMDKFNGQGQWLDPEEAVAMGYADKVFEPMRIAASVTIEDIKKYNLQTPKNLEMEELKNKFNELKSWVENSIKNLKPEEKPEDISAQFNTKIEEMEAKIKEQQVSNDEALAGKVAEIETLTADLQTQKDLVTAKTTEIETLQSEVSALMAKPTDTKAEGDPPIPGEKEIVNAFDSAAQMMQKELGVTN